jgi:hypothetical protein
MVVLVGAVAPNPPTVAASSSGDQENLTRTVFRFKTRYSFETDKDYGQYVRKTLRVGWRVRAAVDYGPVKQGSLGTYYGTNEGEPPCLVIWDKDVKSGSVLLPNVPPHKATHAYWFYWHQVEIIGTKP